MRILIARESALCQLLCSLTFEMGGGEGEKEGKSKPRLAVVTFPQAPSPKRQDSALPLGKALKGAA